MIILGLNDFLEIHKRMRIACTEKDWTVLQGHYELNAQYQGSAKIQDVFHLEIIVPLHFPKAIPVVYELGGKIPRESKYHVFVGGSLCMGSPLRLKMILYKEPSLLTFSEKVLTPYLYSFCHKIQYGEYPYGELAHNALGLIEDYKALFKVHDEIGVLRALSALSKSLNVADKLPCPCCNHKFLGDCEYSTFLNGFRQGIPKKEAKNTLRRIRQEKANWPTR